MFPDRRRIYIAYGSNLHPRRLEARIGSAQLLDTVALPGWTLRFDKRGGDGSAKANLHAAPIPGNTAFAAAYAIGPDQLRVLDEFEGCGGGYETFAMTVSLRGRPVSAFTYLTPSQWLSTDLLPFDWYVDLIASGARFLSFDEAYIRTIVTQSTREDPDHDRARSELGDMDLPLHAHYKR